MNDERTRPGAFDLRIQLYRLARQAAVFVVVLVVVKYALIDTVLVTTDQMMPALQPGDRVLLSRLSCAVPFSLVLGPPVGRAAVFADPADPRKLRCLRIAGRSGDSMFIQSGYFTNVTHPLAPPRGVAKDEDTLPPEYSPRDCMALLRVPGKGDLFVLDMLNCRDFYFLASVIRQENPRNRYGLHAQLFVDGQPAPGYRVPDFSLYKGTLDSVPETLRWDYFFWDRLRAYLADRLGGKSVSLLFWLDENGARLYQYKVKGPCVFLLADDWNKGFDSRYFGPVSASLLRGRCLAVLWSFRPAAAGWATPRIGRLGRIVR